MEHNICEERASSITTQLELEMSGAIYIDTPKGTLVLTRDGWEYESRSAMASWPADSDSLRDIWYVGGPDLEESEFILEALRTHGRQLAFLSLQGALRFYLEFEEYLDY